MSKARRVLIGCAAIMTFVLAGCTSADPSADGQTSTQGTVSASVISPPTPSATAVTADSSSRTSAPSKSSTSGPAVSPSVTDPTTRTATSASGSVSASVTSQEAEDRAAVENQWKKYWDTYLDIFTTEKSLRAAAAAAVAVEPAFGNLLKSAEYFSTNGRGTYGSVIHRLSWLDDIAGRSEAVLSDCQDQSQFGSLDLQTGKKLTVGVPRDNIKIRFAKGSDDIWRVSDIYFLLDIEC